MLYVSIYHWLVLLWQELSTEHSYSNLPYTYPIYIYIYIILSWISTLIPLGPNWCGDVPINDTPQLPLRLHRAYIPTISMLCKSDLELWCILLLIASHVCSCTLPRQYSSLEKLCTARELLHVVALIVETILCTACLLSRLLNINSSIVAYCSLYICLRILNVYT